MKLYNTLTRKKETFKPIKNNKVGFYSCGPTVYNYAHIGNLRSYVFADILQRSLEYNGYKVKRVMNITDVGHLTGDSDTGEDKLEKGAKREGATVWQIAYRFTKAFFRDAEKLNIRKPAIVDKATDTIEDQIKIIKKLIAKEYAYETDTAVYFDVSKFKKYGKLNGQSLDEKLIAARDEVEEDTGKIHPADFVLWFKLVGKYKNHTMQWDSPWGKGFPGWHIECSAISSKHLGQPFDIHSGGVDHIGTHHTNEIAQSEAAFGKPLANIWMHGEFLNIYKGKMSKSDGTFITINSIKDKELDPLAYRYLLLTAHYRTQMDFSWESLESAQKSYYNLLGDISRERDNKKSANIKPYQKKFKDYISDDLNTPKAIALLWDLVKDPKLSSKNIIDLVKDFDKVLGLDLVDKARKLSKEQSTIPKEIKKLADERWEYRSAKEFDKADSIRLKLAKKGYEIEDKDNEFTIKKTGK
jgi:cysteinyl-tRNA synthetase